MTAATFAILIVTGIILVQFYNPVPEAANQSVRHLVTQVWGGRFVRGVHFWAAGAMYVTAALHMLRVFLTGSYKRPREANWLVGVAMFALVTLALFTGTVLKWDKEGFEALGQNLVKRHKISPHPALTSEGPGDQAPAAESTEPFTHHLRRIGSFGLALLGIIGVLAVLVPPGLGARPVPGIEVTEPPLNFWWLYSLENFFGLPAIIYGELIFFGLLVIIPFVDRSPERFWRRRPLAMTMLTLS